MFRSVGNDARESRRRGLRRICCILLAAWAAIGSTADAESPRGDFAFERLSTGQGLSDSTVNAILQSRRGFLWIGTDTGLDSWDGYRFAVLKHDPGNPLSLSENHVYALAEDAAGALWVGTFAGLDRLSPDRRQVEHFHHHPDDPHSLSHGHVRALAVTADGTLWVGTARGLDRLDPRTGELRRLAGPFNADADADAGSREGSTAADVRALCATPSGELWIGTGSRGLYRLDPDGDEVTVHLHDPAVPGSLPDDRVRALHCDPGGSLWVGTASGLGELDPGTGGFVRHRLATSDDGAAGGSEVSAIHRDREGQLWAGTRHDGLWLLAPDRGTRARFRYDPDDPSSPGSNRIGAIFEDAAGNLWLGTRGGGINKLVHRGPRFEIVDGEGIGGAVRAVHADRGGRVWLATTDGWTRLEPGERPGEEPVVRSPVGRVTAFADDSAGLWIGTADGLHRLDPGTGRAQRRPLAGSTADGSGGVTALVAGRRGELWIGTADGIERRDADGRSRRYRNHPDDPASLSHDRVTVLLEDHAGRLWAGTYLGLDRLGDGDRWQRFLHSSNVGAGPSSNHIWALHEAPPGVLWIGTSSGLDRLDVDSGVFRTYHASRGNTVSCILVDAGGFVWSSSNRGLTKLDPRTGRFREYGLGDGLPGGGFQPGACAETAEEMFFGSNNGLVRFRPGRIRTNFEPPAVALTSVKIFQREVEPGPLPPTLEEIRLTHEDKVLSLEYAALDLTAPEENSYAYRLAGLEDEWIEAGNRRNVTYTHLEPGDYVFRVRASNSDQIWNEEGIALSIHVAPPFWSTWWFRLTSVVAVSSLLLGAHHLRTRGMREKNRQLAEANASLLREIERRRQAEEEKQEVITELQARSSELQRFTYSVSHDLRSPLITIRGFLGMLVRDAKAGRLDRLEDDVGRIDGAARKMDQLLEELLELSRVGRMVNEPQEIAVAELAAEAAKLVAGRIEERGAEIVVASDLPVVCGDRPRLLQVFQNLIDNAVKYMGDQPSPRVEIGARAEAAADGGGPVLYVRDNGIGVDPDDHERIFELFWQVDAGTEGTGVGLALVQRIVELHGGRIWVESPGRGKGSTFCFTLG